MVQTGPIHVYYALEGPDALTDVSDRDRNGLPDRIDDLILQLDTARQIFDDAIGLTPPLQQPRYRSAHQINVFVLALDKGNGRAFDEVVSERPRSSQPLPCGIKIFLDHSIEPSRNITPAHELFHLYQYGYSMFKSRWYLEGMTRWIETLFMDDDKIRRDAARVSYERCEDVWSQSYSAAIFWQQQARASGAPPLLLPQPLRERRYKDGRSVIEARHFIGSAYLRHTLEKLGSASQEEARARSIPSFNWPETLQNSGLFDSLICAAAQP